MFMLLRLSTWTKDFHSHSSCVVIFQQVFTNGRKENNKRHGDLSILRNYAFNKGIKSIYYVRTFTDDGGEVGANQCESCVI